MGAETVGGDSGGSGTCNSSILEGARTGFVLAGNWMAGKGRQGPEQDVSNFCVSNRSLCWRGIGREFFRWTIGQADIVLGRDHILHNVR